MKKLKNKLISIIIILSMLTGVTIETTIYYIKEHKFNSLIESEFGSENIDELLDDMIVENDKEVKLNYIEKSRNYQIATGTQLRQYLEKNDINIICINGTCFSSSKEQIIIPYKMYENDIFCLKDGESFNITSSDINYTILPNSYDDLENYNVRKLVGIDYHYYDDATYYESYSLTEK